MASETLSVAERGRGAVEAALADRQATWHEAKQGNVYWLVLDAPDEARGYRLRVKTRTSGTWQSSIRYADPRAKQTSPPEFWVFVDLSGPGRPTFYIAPDAWVRRDIHQAHQAYLARHGGHRAVTEDSNHHAIRVERLLEWREAWPQIGLSRL